MQLRTPFKLRNIMKISKEQLRITCKLHFKNMSEENIINKYNSM